MQAAASLLSGALCLGSLTGCEAKRESYSAGAAARDISSLEGRSFEVTGFIDGRAAITGVKFSNGAVATFAVYRFHDRDGTTLEAHLFLHKGEPDKVSADLLPHIKPDAWVSPNGEGWANVTVKEGRAFLSRRGF